MANPIKYSDLVQSDDSISKLIEQLKLAIETYDKMKSSVSTEAKAIQSALKGVNSTTAEGREKIAALSSAAEELASRRQELTAADKQARAALDQLVTVQERSWRGYVNIDNAIKSVMSRNYDAYIKRNEAGMVSYAASIDQASRDLTRLSTAHQQLDDDLSHGRITVEVYEAQLRGVQDAAAKAQTSLDSMISAASNSGSGAGDDITEEFRLSDEALQQLIIHYQEAKSAVSELRSQQSQLDKDYKAGAVSKESYIERSAALDLALRKETDDQKELSKQINLRIRYLSSMEDSYNKLSAEYSTITAELNKLGTVEGAESERKKELTARAAALRTEMKRLKAETGDMSLNVGNYAESIADALGRSVSFRTRLRELTEQMAVMRLEGKANTEEYRRMSSEAGKLRDAHMDASKEIRNMSSDTSTLDSIMGGMTVAGGSLSAVVGLTELWGEGDKDVAEAQRKLQAVMAVTQGLTAIQNQLQSQSALRLGVTRVQTLALTAAQKIQNTVTAQGTKATIAQTLAMKALNLVAKANPWILLGTGIGAAVAALIAFVDDNEDAERALERQQATIDALAEAYRRQMSVVRASGATQEEITSIELRQQNKLIEAKTDYLNKALHIYGVDSDEYREAVRAKTEATDEFIDKLSSLTEQLNKTNEAAEKSLYRRRNGDAAADQRELDEYKERTLASIKAAREVAQSELEQQRAEAERLRQLAVGAQQEAAEVSGRLRWFQHDAEWYDNAADEYIRQMREVGQQATITGQLIEQLNKEEAEFLKVTIVERQADVNDKVRSALDQELRLRRAAEDEKNKYLGDSYERERRAIETNAKRRIEDLQRQLATDKNLTAKGRQAIADTIISIEKNTTVELAKLAQERRKKLRAIDRAMEDDIIAAMPEGENKEREQLRARQERETADLYEKMYNEGEQLSEAELIALTQQADAMYARHSKELNDLNDRYALEAINHQHETLQLRVSALREDTAEYIRVQTELIEQERQAALAANRQKPAEQQQDEADINASFDRKKYTAIVDMQMQMFDRQQEYERAAFISTRHTQAEITQFEAEQQMTRFERYKEYLRVNKLLTDEEATYIDNLIKKIKRDMGSAAEQAKMDAPTGLKKWLTKLNKDNNENLTDEQAQSRADEQIAATNEAIQTSIGFINDYISAWQELAQAKVDAAKAEVDAAQSAVDAEMTARANGYANNVSLARRELAEKKKIQQEALREQQKAQRAQEALDTAQQVASLITASANIYKALSSIPFVGVPLATALIGAMFASFAASKIKAAQLAQTKTESYGEGTVELLRGGSHASGHDIDLGTKPDGTRRRAEGGEYFAVINKRSSRRFRHLIPSVIDSLNRGDFPDRYMGAYDMSRLVLPASGAATDVSRIEDDLRAIKRQGEKRYYIDGNGNTVIIDRRHRRVIKKIQ